MTASHSRFDHIKFRQLIETELGHGGIKKLSDAIHVTTKTIHSWMNGNTQSGPKLSSWDEMKKYFAKRGISLKREEFYTTEKDVQSSSGGLSEPSEPEYNTDSNANTQKIKDLVSSLKDDVSSLKSNIEKANDIISQLEVEIKHLKQ